MCQSSGQYDRKKSKEDFENPALFRTQVFQEPRDISECPKDWRQYPLVTEMCDKLLKRQDGCV